MRRVLTKLLGGLLIVLLLGGCGGPRVPIVGEVTDAYTGRPIAGATVSVGQAQMTTSSEGRFEAPSWSTADAVQVAAPGYDPVTIPLAELPEAQQPTAPAVTVKTTLRPNTLIGTITDAYSGEPLAGASISVGGATLKATSGPDGSFTLEGVPERFGVEIAAAGYEPTTQQIERTTALEASLRPNVLSGTLTDATTGAPIVGAAVSIGGASAKSAADGSFRVAGVPEQGTLSVEAEGYAAFSAELKRQLGFDAELWPDQVRGSVVSAADGLPVEHFTVLARSSLDTPAETLVRVNGDSEGKFTLDDMPQQGFVQVLAPGFKQATVEIKDGKVDAASIALEPFQTKGLYITAGIASAGLAGEYLDLIDRTELNTLVIDLKSDMRDDLGLVYYDSQVPLAQELGIAADYVDMQAIVDEAKQRGIYTVARIQLFSHDNALPDARPEWAILDTTTGQPYSDFPGPGIRYTWLDPTNRDVWQYNIDLGVEAALMGFDEVNYDYIRFPDNPVSDYDDFQFSDPTVHPEKNPEAMFQTIIGFMDAAHDAVNAAGAFMSVDVFGRVVIARSLPISQDIATMTDHADYVMPMIYPSLWWSGYASIDLPVAEPYATIKAALLDGQPKYEGKYGKLRPWLQDHTDPWAPVVVEYGPAEVRAQIQAAADVDPRMGWILYNSANVYTEEALKPE
jgi:hypothetical protein